MANVNNETLLLIFVACTGVAVLMQALILLAFYIAFRTGLTALQEQVKEIRINVLPVVKETKLLLADVGPKISSLAGDFAAISRDLRLQGSLINSSANEIAEKVNRQASRLDMMLTNALDVADRASVVVADAVNVPLRQVAAITAFAKAVVNSLRIGARRPQVQPRPTHSAADRGQFV